MTLRQFPPGVAGHNRTMVTPSYAVMPPEGILESRLPGWAGAKIRFHTSPQMGARFAQALLEVAAGGGTEGPFKNDMEHFYYVLDGSLTLTAEHAAHDLGPGGYAFVPAGMLHAVQAPRGGRAIWIKRPFADIGIGQPPLVVGRRADVSAVNKHTEGRTWQHLLPEDDLRFDLAVNILSFAPGTHFPFVETHIMEHGLYMLEGQGLYLLGREWHECWTGDFIWMGPYCPQQFYATGWGTAAYLLYKDVNRDVSFG